MKKTRDGNYQLAATDLSNYLSCGHATRLDKEQTDGSRGKPPFIDQFYNIRQLGLEHERRYVENLKAQGHKIKVLNETEDAGSHVERTIEALHGGYDYIIQAAFESERWHGRADILKKVGTPSKLGPWSYEVMDTKLAQETKGGMILQLCVYSALLQEIQGEMPQYTYVVKPGDPFEVERFRLNDFQAYYRWIRGKLEGAIDTMDQTQSYPEPVPFCDSCRWRPVCDQQRREDDHLTFVAGLHSAHIKELRQQSLDTLRKFALAETIAKPGKGSIETYKRLQKQAFIQYDQRTSRKLKIEPLDFEKGEGLTRLPEPDEGDIFFDIEADRFYPDGSIEYLLGVVYREKDEYVYQPQWALDRLAERRVFNNFMQWLKERFDRYPDMHIYHFGHYEPSAIKHLMLRYSIWADDVDHLSRNEKFIDLHSILRQSVRAGVENYGLKEIEPYYGFHRNTKLQTASNALRHIQRALELNLIGEIMDEDREVVSSYNEDDCRSTLALRNWLEKLRHERIASGEDIPRPEIKDKPGPDKSTDRDRRILEVLTPLVATLPDDENTYSDQQKQIKLLTDLLEYFRREDKNFWWEYYRINSLEPDEILDERKAVYGLQFHSDVSAKPGTLPVHLYTYPPQEFAGDQGDILEVISPLEGERIRFGTIQSHDIANRRIEIKKTGESRDLHRPALQINDYIKPDVLESALLRFAHNILDDGIDGAGKFLAGRDLLFRKLPRLTTGERGIPTSFRDYSLANASGLGAELNASILAIQGPPGTGKTYTGAQMICDLHSSRKRIGVTAVSHKAIDNLLKEVGDTARKNTYPIRIAHKDKKDSERPEWIETLGREIDKVIAKLDHGYVIGATAYTWSHHDLEGKLDYLIVDEAGQMSLAYVLAISGAATNIVLLGDPQQLDQPQKAAHPGGADISALQHYIGADRQTIEDGRGLFIGITRRLHPEICSFTSKVYYASKLKSLDGLEVQEILGNPAFEDVHLLYVPVGHTGNSSHSPEEVEAVLQLVKQLLKEGTEWIKFDENRQDQRSQPLTYKDIMVVAPYNAQVSAIKRADADLHVGTVDKFQGKEAAVVIYSMTSSSAEDAPRGMSFLYLPNRLNVASSRARCLFILVASPRLLEPECRTVDQMRWANGLCVFREASHIF